MKCLTDKPNNYARAPLAERISDGILSANHKLFWKTRQPPHLLPT